MKGFKHGGTRRPRQSRLQLRESARKQVGEGAQPHRPSYAGGIRKKISKDDFALHS
jgi:hypothetical protein